VRLQEEVQEVLRVKSDSGGSCVTLSETKEVKVSDGWEKRAAKEWRSVDVACMAQKILLEPRLELAQARQEKLSDAAVLYEEETEETPETFARLNRMIDVANRAQTAVDRLEERIEIMGKVMSLHEDEAQLRTRKRKRRKQRA